VHDARQPWPRRRRKLRYTSGYGCRPVHPVPLTIGSDNAFAAITSAVFKITVNEQRGHALLASSQY
jgi:hypothetical protein